MIRKLLKGIIWILVALTAVAASLAFIPPLALRYTPSAVPCKTYEEAIARFNTLLEATPSDVRDICHPFLLTHGSKSAQVIVLLHGLTNCPEQYRKLAAELYAQGYNVLVPLTPYHGRENRLTDALEHLTPEDLLQSADEALAIAHGLGDKVTLAGLSVNGVTVAWYAQNTQLADRVILLAPFLGIHSVSPAYMPYLSNFFSRFPNQFFWWNSTLKQNIPGPYYAYPRAATQPIGRILQFAEQIIRQAKESTPKTKEIIAIYSKSDTVINRKTLMELLQEWEKSTKLTVYEFPAEEKVPHDMIDPHQPDQQVDIVYPVLLKFFAQPY